MTFSARGKTTGIMEVTNAENDAISRERNRWTDMAGQGGEKSGSYSNMQLTAVRELSSCAPKSQLRHRCHKIQRMITDAAIFEATNEVEKAEQELKGLSEALDNMKVRS